MADVPVATNNKFGAGGYMKSERACDSTVGLVSAKACLLKHTAYGLCSWWGSICILPFSVYCACSLGWDSLLCLACLCAVTLDTRRGCEEYMGEECMVQSSGAAR